MYYNITAIIIKTNLNAYSLTHILYLLMVHIIITDLRELEMLSMWYKIYVDFLTNIDQNHAFASIINYLGRYNLFRGQYIVLHNTYVDVSTVTLIKETLIMHQISVQTIRIRFHYKYYSKSRL